MRRAIPVIVACAVLIAACAGDTAGRGGSAVTPSAEGPSEAVVTPSPEPEVAVTNDVRYATSRGDLIPAFLDVYAPPGADGLPLVVLFHGAGPGVDKDSLDYPDLAEAIARGGAVVVVASWGQGLGMPWDGVPATRSTAQVVRDQRLARDQVACAVSFAVTHAAGYGADPSRLVLFGHSGGANQAGTVGLTTTAAFPGCEVRPASWSATGLMLWEGDWLLANPGFDVFETDMPRLLDVMTPWPSLDAAPDVPHVEFAVSDNAREVLHTPDASVDAEWLSWRDPSGEMQRVLDELGAFRDGYLDVGEEAEAMVAELRERGFDAALLRLIDPSTVHESLAPTDFDLMVEHVLSLAGVGSS
jgi:hypothetical protein